MTQIKTWNRQTKRHLVGEARRLVRKKFPHVPADAACLYLHWALCSLAQGAGLRFLLQAGTAYWPRVTPETDDGVSSNVFGYEWEGIEAPRVQLAIAADVLPEMHVWAGDPATGEIIDLTTGAWPRQCAKLHGQPWLAPKPPDFWWGSPAELPELARYQAHRDACELVIRLITRVMGR